MLLNLQNNFITDVTRDHCNENRRLLPWKQMTETLSCLEVHRCMKVGRQKHIELNKLNTKTHSTELV